jgi:hypothetical protein
VLQGLDLLRQPRQSSPHSAQVGQIKRHLSQRALRVRCEERRKTVDACVRGGRPGEEQQSVWRRQRDGRGKQQPAQRSETLGRT